MTRACFPFSEIDEAELEERVRALQESTHVDLSQWRTEFEEFLDSHYAEPRDYVVGQRPDSVPSETPQDLPGRWEQNDGDRRAYSWEIRLTEGLRLDDNLEKWATDTGTETTLKRLASTTTIPVDSARGSASLWKILEETDKVIDEIDVDAIEALQAQVEEEVLS